MKKIWIYLSLAILIRIFLSVLTFHPDIQALANSGKFVVNGHILNLYDYNNSALVLNYPPLIYWFFGLFDFLFNGSLPLLKLSYILFDLLLGILLYKMVDPKKAVLVFAIWIFNPINLYATYMMGQFDIIPTFFTVLSVYLASRNKLGWSALALGGGIAFKMFPLFLIIPLLTLAKNYRTKIQLTSLAILPYLISIFPYISSRSFRTNALFASQSSKSLYATIPVSGGEAIILFPMVLLLFYLVIWNYKYAVEVWKIYLIPLLLFFIFTHFHPQWLLWITPFLIIDLIKNDFKNILIVVIILLAFIGSLFFFDSSLTVGIFAPILPALKSAPDIWTLLNLHIDYNFSRSLLQTLFVSAAVYLIYQFFPKRNV